MVAGWADDRGNVVHARGATAPARVRRRTFVDPCEDRFRRRALPALVFTGRLLACVHAAARREKRPACSTGEWRPGHSPYERWEELERRVLSRRETDGLHSRARRRDRSLLYGSWRRPERRIAEERDQAHPRRRHRRRKPTRLGCLAPLEGAGPVTARGSARSRTLPAGGALASLVARGRGPGAPAHREPTSPRRATRPLSSVG